MASLAAIRDRSYRLRLAGLRRQIADLMRQFPAAEVWLFGSLARGDWDGFSDVDLLAIALTANQANNLADALLGNGIADDVIALTQADWQCFRNSTDPYWRSIGNDAFRLDQP